MIQENTTGSATIDNSGTIGAAVASTVTSTTYAIVETGGAITINNSHEINGNISVAHGPKLPGDSGAKLAILMPE